MLGLLFQAAMGMFGYMTEIESVNILMEDTVEVDGKTNNFFLKIKLF
jgi:hypothetical protein